MWKRISSFLFDFIMRMILIAGIAVIMSALLGYDAAADRFDELSAEYMEKYQVDLSQEEYDLLSEADKEAYRERYDEANLAFNSDPEAQGLYEKMINLILLMLLISIVSGYAILEFIVPLLFKNGQTLGKKIFGVGVMRDDGVRINSRILFARAILGKCVIEAMVPIAIIIMIVLGGAGMLGLIALLLLAALEIFLMIKTKTNSCIHDLLSYSVTVDMASQMIFDSTEALVEYKNRVHAEMAENADY